MGPKDRRMREKEELRGRILDAARELFAEQGYEAVTMRKIAEAIEYSPTALYLHFPDKESIVRELCLADFDALAGHFQKLAQVADPIERLRGVGAAYAEFGMSHPHHYRLMFMTPHAPLPDEKKEERRGNPEADAYAFLRWTLAEAIATGRLRPEYTDPDLLSQAVWAGVHGLVSLRIAKCNDDWIDWRSLEATLALVLDLQLRGLLAAPETAGER